jgi:hypothetical protein
MRSIVVAAMAIALVGCSDDTTEPATSFTASLLPSFEVPAVTNAPGANGSATCTVQASPNISCDVTYASLTGAPTQAHIHLGNSNATGAVRVNLCGSGGAPACPATAAGTITSGNQPATQTGTQTPADAHAAVVAAMRTFGAYVNVHTTLNGGGEIRGQLIRQ